MSHNNDIMQYLGIPETEEQSAFLENIRHVLKQKSDFIRLMAAGLLSWENVSTYITNNIRPSVLGSHSRFSIPVIELSIPLQIDTHETHTFSTILPQRHTALVINNLREKHRLPISRHFFAQSKAFWAEIDTYGEPMDRKDEAGYGWSCIEPTIEEYGYVLSQIEKGKVPLR